MARRRPKRRRLRAKIAPAKRKRKKSQLSPIHGRMLRRRAELVRLYRDRQEHERGRNAPLGFRDDDVDLDDWLPGYVRCSRV